MPIAHNLVRSMAAFFCASMRARDFSFINVLFIWVCAGENSKCNGAGSNTHTTSIIKSLKSLSQSVSSKPTSSNADPVGAADQLHPHVPGHITMDKSGYLYVFVSNETQNVNVYFDNLEITRTRGPLLEETHYYPFGLQIASAAKP